jgi:hypothetical protein
MTTPNLNKPFRTISVEVVKPTPPTVTLEANDIQIAGTHYKDKKIQPWDFIVANGLSFLEGNVVKYVCRHNSKGGLDDLKKAQHYLQKLIEVVEEENLVKAIEQDRR